MKTYGTRRNQGVVPLPRIRELREEIVTLQNQLATEIANCEHHFVPVADSIKNIRVTKVASVYHAGNVGEMNAVSEVYFDLECAKCGTKEKQSISHYCPLCASKTKGTWGLSKNLNHYFIGDFGYCGLWMIVCSAKQCSFRTAGLR